MIRRGELGFTLAELVMVAALIAILSAMVLPVAKFTVKRRKEAELRLSLRQMRSAIDVPRTPPTAAGHPPDGAVGTADPLVVATQRHRHDVARSLGKAAAGPPDCVEGEQ